MAAPMVCTLVGVCDEEIPVSYVTKWQCNKLGGYPDWMYLNINQPICIVCGDPLYLVVQLYCPLQASSYHRTIYIFTCVRRTCLGKPESWRVFRCQLPVTTPPSKGAKQVLQETPIEVAMAIDEWCDDADDWGSESDYETHDEQISSLTSAKSHELTYSSAERIVATELTDKSHKSENEHSVTPPESVKIPENGDLISDVMNKLSISTETTENMSSIEPNCLDLPSFKSYFVSVFDEPSSSSLVTELTNHERELMLEYQKREVIDMLEWQKHSLNLNSSSGIEESYEKVTAKHGDEVFQRFSKKLRLCPEQCIRYSWNGSPLYLISPSEGSIIPPCQHCREPRVFEFQLMPSLISVLRSTSQPDIAVDFGVVMIYTCQNSCWIDTTQPGQCLLKEEHLVIQADPDSLLLTQATSLVLPQNASPVTSTDSAAS